MSEIKVCGIVLCALVVCVFFKNLKSEYSLFVRLIITALISMLTLAVAYPILTFVDEITKNTTVYQYLPTLIKALGIAFCVQLTSDICIDAGEGALSEKINIFGKVEIIILTLPLIRSLFNLAEGLVKWKKYILY